MVHTRARTPPPPDYSEHLAAIRRLFLRPPEFYSLDELAALWRVDENDVRDIYHDEIARSGDERIAWPDVVGASIRFTMLRPVDIERALGLDLPRVLSEAWRTAPVVIHLPRFVAEAVALEPSVPADLSISTRVERMLMELYGNHQTREGGIVAFGEGRSTSG